MSIDNLARFRADPSKVRVSVRPEGDTFVLKVEDRRDPKGNQVKTWCRANEIEKTMNLLLNLASGQIEGIDIGMQWEYPHPMRAT